MLLSNDLTSRLARTLFTALMAVAWCGLPNTAAAQPQPMTPDRKRAADASERLMQLLDAADREGPRDTFDVRGVLQKVGNDPEKLFEWVRDNTCWVPYRGALRGPVGVLMDRVGNSLDRSLLLAELLRAAGADVKLVHARLDEAQASKLLAKVRPLPKGWAAHVDEPSDETTAAELDRYAGRFGLEPARLRAGMDESLSGVRRLTGQVVRRVAEQAPAIAAAGLTGSPPADPRAAAEPAPPDVVDAARDHWWVAVSRPDGRADLDTMLPGAKPGDRATEAKADTLSYDGNLPADPALCHEVRIQVTVERSEGPKREEFAVLTHALRPADVLGKRIALGYLPTHWPADLDVSLLSEKDASERLRAAAASQHEWVPVLAVGTEIVMQGGFDDTGGVNPKPNLDALKGAGVGAGKAGGGVLDAFAPSPTEPPAQAAGELTAVWIDYEIRAPGAKPKKIRRQFLDLLGTSARQSEQPPVKTPDLAVTRALALLGETEIVVEPCRLSQAFANHVATSAVLANRKLITSAVGGAEPDGKALADQLANVVQPPGLPFALAIRRWQFSPVSDEVYLDRPNVLTHHSIVKLGADGNLQLYEGFDIVFNDVAVRAGDDRSDARDVRLRQGVADTAAEAALSGGGLGNASELFAADSAKGTNWVTFRKPDDPALAALDLPRDTVACIRADLADGYVVMVPEHAAGSDGRAVAAWWRIDPHTGQTLGIGQQGWGQSAVETALLVARIMLKMALWLKCLAGHASDRSKLICHAILCLGLGGLCAGGVVGAAIALLADFASLWK